ncbi:MAG: glycyl-radical enzyme activating protein, partial [Anaerovoracaceae bacterium]
MSNKSIDLIERKALIFNVQKYNMHDGPGVRTMVFFKGCPLRCKWCANPEGLDKYFQIMYKRDHCVHCGKCVSVCPVGVHKMNQEGKHEVQRNVECIGCGKCEEACLPKAISVAGEQRTISELLEIIEEDKPFYELSGGGATLGGGEVTMQPEAATNLLMACKQNGINTAIETCGYVKTENLDKIAEFTDLFLF